jgi:hypothetical protein
VLVLVLVLGLSAVPRANSRKMRIEYDDDHGINEIPTGD